MCFLYWHIVFTMFFTVSTSFFKQMTYKFNSVTSRRIFWCLISPVGRFRRRDSAWGYNMGNIGCWLTPLVKSMHYYSYMLLQSLPKVPVYTILYILYMVLQVGECFSAWFPQLEVSGAKISHGVTTWGISVFDSHHCANHCTCYPDVILPKVPVYIVSCIKSIVLLFLFVLSYQKGIQ